MITDDRLTANRGTLYVSGTTEVTGLTRYAVVPREATTITSITGTDGRVTNVDILALMGLSVSVTLNADELWVCPIGYTITAIKLATGTVRLY